MNKHTAGPWKVEWATIQGGEGHTIHDSTNDPELGRIASVYFHDDAEGETNANARLIAAAPSLLEALQMIVVLSGSDTASVKARMDKASSIARAAIAKATGQ